MGFVSRFANVAFSASRGKPVKGTLRALTFAGLMAFNGVMIAPAATVILAPQTAHAQSANTTDNNKTAQYDPATISKIEAYLNGITTLKADFVQIASDGSTARGTMYMERPGKMRFEYDPPAQILLVSTGHDLIYYDKEINAPTYMNIDDTPAGLILAKHVSLTEKVNIVGYRKTAETVRVTLVRKSDPGAGSVTLVFQDDPMELRQWVVTDPTGIETTVTLYNADTGMKLDPKLFTFKRIWPKSGS